MEVNGTAAGRGDADGWPEADFARFPSPVAVADPAPAGSAVSVHLSSWEEQTVSVELRYRVAGRLVLLVRSACPPNGDSPRGVPVESLASTITNFQLGTAAFGGGPLTDERPPARPPGAAARAAVAEAPHLEVSVRLDLVPARAVRVDVLGCAAVEVPREAHTIFCAGTPAMIDTLRLALRPYEEINTWRDAHA